MAIELKAGASTSGLTGGTITGGVAGFSFGVGNASPNPTAVCLVSNTSTVSGLLMESVSVTGWPVETPKGKTSLPAVR